MADGTEQAPDATEVATITSITMSLERTAVLPATLSWGGVGRFFDSIGKFFVKHENGILVVAQDAEPIVMALSPFGPEYDLVVNALVGLAHTSAAAKAATGTGLSDAQVVAYTLPQINAALVAILKERGITEPNQVSQLISQYVQYTFGMMTLPAVKGEAAAKMLQPRPPAPPSA